MNKDNVWAYPNPVKPDYTGIITITGLSNKADIKSSPLMEYLSIKVQAMVESTNGMEET